MYAVALIGPDLALRIGSVETISGEVRCLRGFQLVSDLIFVLNPFRIRKRA
jgi:hypothetical protein